MQPRNSAVSFEDQIDLAKPFGQKYHDHSVHGGAVLGTNSEFLQDGLTIILWRLPLCFKVLMPLLQTCGG
jgi:hypothetical protein